MLLQAWNQLESPRGPMCRSNPWSLGCSAEFNGIGLKLRIDRIDRIGEAHLVIDYKTGRKSATR